MYIVHPSKKKRKTILQPKNKNHTAIQLLFPLYHFSENFSCKNKTKIK